MKLESLTYNFAADSGSMIFIQIFLVSSIQRTFSAKVHIGCSRSSKVIDYGTNLKLTCDFLQAY